MAELASDERARHVARELTRVRQRGIEDLNFTSRKQPPVLTPYLKALAAQLGHRDPDRIDALRSLLDDQLMKFKASGRRYDADLIRGLLFDVPDAPRSRPQVRLDRERTKSGLTDDQFSDRQQAVFRDFATFMVEAAEQAPQAAGDVQEVVPDGGQPQRRLSVLRYLVATLILTLVVGTAVYVLGDPGQPSGQSSGTSDGASSPPTPVLEFDSYGSTASNVINVYPGVTTSDADKMPNGSFLDGDIVPALCKVEGRTVATDPTYGEVPRSKSTWIRIEGSPGKTQYASLTYADVSEGDLGKLQSCL